MSLAVYFLEKVGVVDFVDGMDGVDENGIMPAGCAQSFRAAGMAGGHVDAMWVSC